VHNCCRAAEVFNYHDTRYEKAVHAIGQLDDGQLLGITVTRIPYDDCDTCYREGKPCAAIEDDYWIGSVRDKVKSIQVHSRKVLSFFR
jgi:hypothetical protein